MSHEYHTSAASSDQYPDTPVLAHLPRRAPAKPWLTILVVIVCTTIFVGVTGQNDKLDWKALARFGYLPAAEVWNGAILALVTSTFVHVEAWHFVGNLYWLWVFGSRLEQALGPWRYLLFYLVAAFVSSAIQMAASDTTGIGASGVLYAMFGFMWATRRRYPAFYEAVNNQTVFLLLVWMFGCFVVTHFKMMNIGNAAHLSGLAFGASVAGCFVYRDKWLLSRVVLTALVTLSIVVLVWCPGSTTWLSVKAYNAHVAGRYAEAASWYTQIIQRDPNNAWAYANRGNAYHSLGRIRTANADFEVARKLDPSLFPETPAE